MADMIHVVFSVYNRPDLLRTALESWREVRGVDEVSMDFWIEPGCEESVKVCAHVDWAAATTVAAHSQHLGHAASVFHGMERAFERTGYAICAVEDYVVTEDVLELFSWHREGYADDGTVLCLRAGTDFEHDGGYEAVWRTQLMGLPAGFHSTQWARLASRWSEATDRGWWQWVNEQFLQGGPGLDVLAPALSRAEDIEATPDHLRTVPDAVQYAEVTRARERAIGFHRYIEEAML